MSINEATFDQAAAKACEELGVVWTGYLPSDGRLDIAGDPHGENDASIVAFADGRGGCLTNFKTGEQLNFFHAALPNLSPEQMQAVRDAAESEIRVKHEKASADAIAAYNAALPVTSSAYLTRKGVGAHSLRMSADGYLLVPMRDAQGLCAINRICDASGDKRFPKGSKLKGMSHAIDDSANTSKIVICEGFSTGATIYEATGLYTVCAASQTNLRNVALDFRTRFPGSQIIIAGDQDAKHQDRGPKAAHETALAVGGVCALPPLSKGDWNDYAASVGLSVMKAEFERASANAAELFASIPATLPPGAMPLTGMAGFKVDGSRSYGNSELIKALIPIAEPGAVVLVFGPSRSGKSFLVLLEAMGLASGQSHVLGQPVRRQTDVVYLATESYGTIQNRCAAIMQEWGISAGTQVPLTVLDGSNINLFDQAHKARLISSIKASGSVGLLCIDTLAKAFLFEDVNRAEEVIRAYQALADIGREIGCVIVGVHHAGKDAGSGPLGSQAWTSAFDCCVSVSANIDEVSGTVKNRKVNITKDKNAESGGGTLCCVDIKSIPFGVNLYGEPMFIGVMVVGENKAEENQFREVMANAFEIASGKINNPNAAIITDLREVFFGFFENSERSKDSIKSGWKRELDHLLKNGFTQQDGRILKWLPNEVNQHRVGIGSQPVGS